MDHDVLGGLQSLDWKGPLRDHRNDGVEFGGETNVRDGMDWVKARVELMRERWEQGLDIWTGEPSDEK